MLLTTGKPSGGAFVAAGHNTKRRKSAPSAPLTWTFFNVTMAGSGNGAGGKDAKNGLTPSLGSVLQSIPGKNPKNGLSWRQLATVLVVAADCWPLPANSLQAKL